MSGQTAGKGDRLDFDLSGFGRKILPSQGARIENWDDFFISIHRRASRGQLHGWYIAVTMSGLMADIFFDGIPEKDRRCSFQFDPRGLRLLIQVDRDGFLASIANPRGDSRRAFITKCSTEMLGIPEIVVSDIREHPRIDPRYVHLERDRALVFDLDRRK